MKSDNLPKDAMMEILTRLPAKSLLRCKCVCKSWCNLVEDPDFVEKHYEMRASSTQSNSILVTRYLIPEDEEEYVMFSLLYDEPPKGIQYLDLDGPFESNSREIYGVRGVFCVSYLDESEIRHAYLWNPATREYKSLPTTEDPEAPPNACVWKCHLALGFDHKTSDYKVVRVWTFHHFPKDDVPEYYSHKVEVCSLRASKSWRHIDAVPPDILLSESECHIYLKGKYYWESIINSSLWSLISFDFGTEEFQMLQLPNDPIAEGSARILVLNSTFALVRFTSPTNNKRVEIWLMNEDGDNVSWAMYMTLDTEWKEEWTRLEALAFFKNDHLLVQTDEGFLSFSLSSSQDSKDLDIKFDALEAPILYNECLVLFD